MNETLRTNESIAVTITLWSQSTLSAVNCGHSLIYESPLHFSVSRFCTRQALYSEWLCKSYLTAVISILFTVLTATDTTLLAPGVSPNLRTILDSFCFKKEPRFSTASLKKDSEEMSAYLCELTLSLDKLLLYLVKLSSCTSHKYTQLQVTLKVVLIAICGLFFTLKSIAGGGIGRKREAAILELAT